MSDIFREIDEELRRDNLLALWARYGRHIIAVVILVLVAAGGIAAWRSHQLLLRQAESARFASGLALARAGRTTDAAMVFATIAKDGGGYGVLASFEDAALLRKSGSPKKAAAAYDRIAEESNVSPVLRGLATVLSVMQDDNNPKATIMRLEPLTTVDSPWRPTALELSAAAELKLGDNKAALSTYKTLADDLAAPHDMRARAAGMVAALAP
ncbi:MAG: tetratricopeptide repeat protein [Alphaproteobacteria bacterium]|nr:tetratricopeptide repeat protein [Alphaproteobacteria bacterium]